MHYHIDEPLFTTIKQDASQLRPQSGSLYISGTSVEERSLHTTKWEANCPDVVFAHLQAQDRAVASLLIGDTLTTFRLRSAKEINAFLSNQHYIAVYLDVTGLPHHVWAPLLRALRSRSEPAYVVYIEPGEYRFSSAPTEATIFDLSESIEGIGPLPGFVSLSDDMPDEALFVPLLGFEGPRFRFILETVQPKRSNICPVIGVPGFRPEYPFYTYLGNRLQLEETKAWQNVRFAAANCPFSIYQLLQELAREHYSRRLKIALIGTKPHALGAVLYYLDHQSTTELVYDYPVRKAKRTTGISRACIYDLSLMPPIRIDRGERFG
jgi:hypothetical protein